MKKALMFLGTIVAVLALTAGTASAHFCYNAKRSDKGNEQVAAKSNGFATFAELLAEFGLCESGIAYVEANAPATIPLDVPINVRATMAGGTFRSGNDAKGIDHIEASDADWDAFDAVIDDAFVGCSAP